MSFGDLLGTLGNRGDMNPRTLLLGCVALWLLLFSLLSWLSGGNYKDMVSAKSEYTRVSALVEKVLDRQSGRGDLAGQQPVAAVRKVSTDLKLESTLASVREEDMGARTGVAVFFEALDGRQLVELVKALQQRTGLTITECTINHRLDSPTRADMHLTLMR